MPFVCIFSIFCRTCFLPQSGLNELVRYFLFWTTAWRVLQNSRMFDRATTWSRFMAASLKIGWWASLCRAALYIGTRQATLCTVCVCVPYVGDVSALASGAPADRHNVTLALAPWHRLAHCECRCRATIGATAPLLEPPGGDYLPRNIAHQQSLSTKALLNSSQNQLRANLVVKEKCSILALVPAAAAGDIDRQIFFSKPPFLLLW